MSIDSAARPFAPFSANVNQSPVTLQETIELGQQVIASEARAVMQLLGQLGAEFYEAVEHIRTLRGSVHVTGVGKAGLIGQKLAATFSSTGTRAYFLHPSEAFHGDLGQIRPGDLVLALSQSGESSEVVQLLPTLRSQEVTLVAITAASTNRLATAADVALTFGRLNEACSLGLAPSSSTTAMLALGDALALVVSRLKGFQAEDFARFHPGGALGLKLSRVEDHMRPLRQCRQGGAEQTIRQVLASSKQPGRRSGAIMLVDSGGRLTGIFTDSDLARLIEQRDDMALDRPISQFMACEPTAILAGTRMSEAIELLTERKISELPVVDDAHRPIGMIDVTDVVGLPPNTPHTGSSAKKRPVNIRIYPGDEAPETD